MIYKIKNKIDKELTNFITSIDKVYSLRKISPLLSRTIKDFVLRKGKRVRPILFIMGYLGFSKKEAKNLYKSALSIELLHDFLLIHDDIIDKSDLRRNKPSMHKIFDNHLKRYKDAKFNGQDLAIITGDLINSFAISAFLSIEEDKKRKEKGLREFLKAAVYTELGESIELLEGLKDIEKITKNDIYKIYDLKTAYYTFSSPLAIGAILGGANKKQIDLISKYGLSSGRAFQIKDDILGIFAEEKRTGKSSLTDLKEAKKTILIWYAYNHSDKEDKLVLKRILTKQDINRNDLLRMRKIITTSGALDYAKRQILDIKRKGDFLIKSSKMQQKYKDVLNDYCNELLIIK